jgi:hypothetical protein
MERNIYKIGKELFITSDEETKEGDYFISLNDDESFMEVTKNGLEDFDNYADEDWVENCKKIILTTDQDLIKDGIQAIDDEFLEWFVKNPSCEFVEVTKGSYNLSPMEKMLEKEYVPKGTFDTYKIIITKEEPKQAERMYSEKEVLNILKSFKIHIVTELKGLSYYRNQKHWFEQFKKK